MEEVKAAVFGLNGDSTCGPDGFTRQFNQDSWEVIGEDIFNMVRDFFNSAGLPSFITHTNLVLLPKKKNVPTFSDMRPIRLSNLSNKIISRVNHERLVEILPSLISPNQAGFVKGRSIKGNILLTQEIITDIRLRGKPANMVIKLDMAKAYDRVSWLFFTKMLRQIGFGEIFTSEVLRRALDALFDNPDFIGFGMLKWSQNINYLSYADDTIISCSSHYGAVQLIMNILGDYEAASGQKINKEKSSVYMHEKAHADEVNIVYLITEFQRKYFPFSYLGCPIFYSRRKDFYKRIIFKVHERLSSWKGKLLSIGGRAVLIAHVLESMPIHLLSAVNPSVYVINQLHKMFARFY
uniref:Reverse transcriptase domain-containing protein n=1 Tax=Nicotiana tabacum TaxID=4097 RepID=A0A1S3X9G1_TOBAC|nr:PREDICTED: uncharacterized protein LOC107762555 [Nicotiana tabacum]